MEIMITRAIVCFSATLPFLKRIERTATGPGNIKSLSVKNPNFLTFNDSITCYALEKSYVYYL